MHIKQVVIQGFRSYREPIVFEFEKGFNVIVGKNGSGKSNFFFAVEFLLGEKYSRMSQNERRMLLYDGGSGPVEFSAKVKIVFDNAHRRFPINKNEIVLSREVSLKKDMYYLENKNITKIEIYQILKNAGFHHSNMYHIVLQGKINNIAMASYESRLSLLKEISNIQLYEEKIKQAKKTLESTDVVQEQLEAKVLILGARLDALEQEKDLASEYDHWERTRRAVEHVIHYKEKKVLVQKLVNLKRQDPLPIVEHGCSQKINSLKEELENDSKALKEAKKILGKVTQSNEFLREKKEELTIENDHLSLNLKNIQENLIDLRVNLEKKSAELLKVKAEIDDKEQKFAENNKVLEAMNGQSHGIGDTEHSRDIALKIELLAKKGRRMEFDSKEQKDECVRQKLEIVEKQKLDLEREQEQYKNELNTVIGENEELELAVSKLTEKIFEDTEIFENQQKDIRDLKEKRNKCLAERKELFSQESNTRRDLTERTDELRKADQKRKSVIRKTVIEGIESVNKILNIFRENDGNVSGYHGLVIDNFEINPILGKAIEAIAGNRLFHHIVKTDGFGKKILMEMNKEKLPGEVTFMPLNRFQIPKKNYPVDSDVEPLMKHLEYDVSLTNAISWVFGKSLLCKSLDIVTSGGFSNFTYVTTNGDSISPDGTLRGGFNDPKWSKFDAWNNHRKLLEQVKELKTKSSEIEENIRSLNNQVSSHIGEIERAEKIILHATKNINDLKEQKKSKELDLEKVKKMKAFIQKNLEESSSKLKALESKKEILLKELNEELEDSPVDERLELEKLNEDIMKFQKAQKHTHMFKKLEEENAKIQNKLHYLIKKRDELKAHLSEKHSQEVEKELRKFEEELSEKKFRLETITHELHESEMKIPTEKKKIAALSEKIEETSAKISKLEEERQNRMAEIHKRSNQINTINQKIDNITNKMRDMQIVPNSETFKKFENLNLPELYKYVKNANTFLNKNSNVNRKALEQYRKLWENHGSLTQSVALHKRERKQINEILSSYENISSEALITTFEAVKKNFEEIFQELVPQGKATLVMNTSNESLDDDFNVENCTGIAIRASFSKETNNAEREMNQLSGGQKSMVAVALIFAFQKYNPAPFYFFDEIDQALDSQHREAVAKMIRKLSETAQFIVTTFKPEMLEYATRFHMVCIRNKRSQVQLITREMAQKLMRQVQA